MRRRLLIILVILISSFSFGFYQSYTINSLEYELDNLNSELELALKEQSDLINEFDNYNIVVGTATAYAPFDNKSGICADGNPEITSKGVRPGPDVIAVDPSEIPYYSEVIVIGKDFVIEATALDTGAAMKNNPYRVDVYQPTYQDALDFGINDVILIWREP